MISRLAKRWARWRQRRFLRRFHRSALRTPRNQPGVIYLAGFKIAYTDLLSLYMEYKDIFVNRIYHFDAESPTPRIIDGGGCIGMSVLYFKSVYPGARITCFEPDEQACEMLRRNVTDNGLTDVELVPAGLTSRAGTAAFLPDGADAGRVAGGTEGGTVIQTVQLSDYLAEPVDFLKLNIEGQELPVLREAGARLRNVNQIVLEYHGWAGAEQRLGAILDLLAGQGFRYLVHDFDHQTSPASKPPFHLKPETNWFCLVYARRLEG